MLTSTVWFLPTVTWTPLSPAYVTELDEVNLLTLVQLR